MTFEEAKNEIKQKINIVDIIGRDVRLKPINGQDFIGLCPFHNEKTPSFHVRSNQQFYHCFGCGKSGDVFKYLEEHNQMSFKEAMDYLCNMIGITYDKGYVDEGFNKRKQRVYDIYKDAAVEYFRLLISDEGKECLNYYKNRKLSFDTIKAFGLGYAPNKSDYMYNFLKEKGYTDTEIIDDAKIAILNKDKNKVYDVWQNRAMFPVLDRMNKVITFSGRMLDDKGWDQRKYVNGYATIIWDKSNNLFCLNKAQNTKEKYFILCEGNMDCISLYQAGFTNAIAPLGTAFTKDQANILTRYNKDVYLALDSDEAGKKSTRTKVIPYFDDLDINCKVIDLSPAKDPDEFIKKFGSNKFNERIDEATDSLIFTVRDMKEDFDMKSEKGKIAYLEAVIDRLVAIKNAPARDVYIKSVAGEINIDESKLTKYVLDRLKNGKNQNAKPSIDARDFENESIKKKSKEIDFNEKKLIEILTDYTELADSVKNILDVEDIENDICKSIYKDIISGYNQNKLIEKYSESGNTDNANNNADSNINKRLITDLIAVSSNLDIDGAKSSLSNIVKKIKIKNLENKISETSDDKILLELISKLNNIKNENINI